jgi:Na+/melibiose symporter-like transporter
MLAAFLVMLLQQVNVAVDNGGWRWMLGVCAFPALLTFFLRIFVPESAEWQQAVQAGPRAGFTEIFSASLRRRTIVAALLGGIALLGTWGSVQWIPLWVKAMTDSQAQANYAQLCSGFGAVVGTLAAAFLGQRLGRRWAYWALCVGSLLVCAYLFRWHFLWATQVDWRFLGVVFLVGAMTASFYGWLPLYLPELFPTRTRATGQGFAYNFGRLIAAVGALSMGFLMSEQVFNGSYARAGATVSLIYVAGLVVIWLAPETRGKPLPE